LTQITGYGTGQSAQRAPGRDTGHAADTCASRGQADGGAWHADGAGHVNAARWPDVAMIPDSRARAAVARALFRRVTARLPVRVVTAVGTTGGGGEGAPRLLLHRPGDFYRRLGAGGLIGFGESYMAGDWDADNLPGLLSVFAARMTTLVPRPAQALRRWYMPRMPAAEDGTPDGARRNIQRHYDLSNDLFALFLDETMTYSAAEFDDLDGSLSPPLAEAKEDSLAKAQRRKVDRILDLAAVGPGSRVLEIGTGWGELAIRAARRGARVDSITLSQEQRELARGRAARAGVAGRVSINLRDYRDATGSYDAIVSVEMIEAVGDTYWPVFFATLDRLLAPGGRIGLQAITMAHDRMLATRNSYTWIHKYIFPGGVIPSARAIEREATRASLRVTARRAFGPHYARTLQLWRARFCQHASEVDALGFDAVFRRMWTLYLAYSEAGFRSGYLNVQQFALEHAP